MSAERATGLVVRTRPLTETSLIVHWITREQGRLATVAKGARRPRSPFRGKLDLFYEADFSFHRSRRSTLHTLREAVLRDTHPALREDFARLCQATYAVLLIEQITEEESPLPHFYALLRELLIALSHGPAQPQLVLGFELKLLAESGLQPNWADTFLRPGTRQVAQALTSFDLADQARLRLTALQCDELRQFLGAFLLYHLGRVPSSRGQALAAGEDRRESGPPGALRLNPSPAIKIEMGDAGEP